MSHFSSKTLRNMYANWSATATPEQIALVDEVYRLAEANSVKSSGAWMILEAHTPEEIIARFGTVKEACKYMEIRHARAKEMAKTKF